jgi:hypothetical protein
MKCTEPVNGMTATYKYLDNENFIGFINRSA